MSTRAFTDFVTDALGRKSVGVASFVLGVSPVSYTHLTLPTILLV